MMTEQEIKDNLRLLLWDTPATPEDAYALLMHDVPCRIPKHNLYQKILNTFPWYKVMEIIPSEKMDYAMSDEVLMGLFPKKIREDYYNARRFILQ